MLPYFYDAISDFPFSPKSAINIEKLKPINYNRTQPYVDLTEISIDCLKSDFKDFLESKIQTRVKKVINMHWFNPTAHIAHIDCNAKGEILPAAFNLVLDDRFNYVNFYDNSIVQDLKLSDNSSNGDHGSVEYNANPVFSIDVMNIPVKAVWHSKGPCLLNTTFPHMVVAPEVRNTISIQFQGEIPFLDLVQRFL
jgi:hypothetical protein